MTWIGENGYRCSGAPYEFYLRTQFDGLSPEDWETEIFFQIEKKYFIGDGGFFKIPRPQ